MTGAATTGRRFPRVRRMLSIVMMPLSLGPLALGVWYLETERAGAGDGPERTALGAPTVTLTASQRARWRPLPPSRGIPVLVYHGINDRNDHYSVGRLRFARHMAMLDAAGFETISPAQYAAHIEGRDAGLPRRPVLVTFDDGRLDSFRGGDAILRRHGFRATMFVITGHLANGPGFYLGADELRRLSASGRWDIELHASLGHVRIPTGPNGRMGPFYANRTWNAGRLESLEAWRRRIESDVDRGIADLTREIPGYRPLLFAVPYGDFGHRDTNDRRIAPALMGALGERFSAVFQTDGTAGPTLNATRHELGALKRIAIHTDTTADDIYLALRAGASDWPAGAGR